MKYLLLLLIMSCATTEFNETSSTGVINHGAYPNDYKTKIHEHFDSTLKDPSSLVIKSMGKPLKAHTLSGTEKPHWYDDYSDVVFNKAYGWNVCVTYRGKNSYGAYTGWKTAVYFFSNKGEFIVPLMVNKSLINGMHRKRSVNGVYYSLESCQ